LRKIRFHFVNISSKDKFFFNPSVGWFNPAAKLRINKKQPQNTRLPCSTYFFRFTSHPDFMDLSKSSSIIDTHV